MKRTCDSYGGPGLYRGRGGFFGGLGGLLTGQGYDAGSKWGDDMWAKVGKYGDSLDKDFGSYFGKGLYRGRGLVREVDGPVTNDLLQSANSNSDDIVPRFHPTDLSEVMYSNREYIADIYAPLNTKFAVTQRIPINPGLVACFPWLSQIAINFEEYELYQLAFTYKATVSDFATGSGQVGQIMMATQANPQADAFANKEEMMLYQGGSSSKTTVAQIQGVECDPSKIQGTPTKYIRAGNLPATEDLKQYDLGVFNLAVENVPTTYQGQQLGELWVSYTVKLRKPKLASGNAYNVHRDVFMVKAPTTTTLLGDSLGNGLIVASRNVLGITVVGATLSETVSASYLNQLPLGAPVPAATDYPDSLNTSIVSPVGATAPFLNGGRFVLPDSFAGIIEMKVSLVAGATAAPVDFFLQAFGSGNISRFKDIPNVKSHQSGSYQWTHINTLEGDIYPNLATPPGTAALFQAHYLTYHFRVNKSTNGIRNQIWLSDSRTSALGGITYNMINVEFTGYNSFLSFQDNGTNDRLTLEAAGQSVVWA